MLIRITLFSCLSLCACRKEEAPVEAPGDVSAVPLAQAATPTQDVLPAAQDASAVEVATDSSEVTAVHD